MIVKTYREVFFKPQDMEFEDDEWDNFEELPEEELKKIDSWEAEAQKQEQHQQEEAANFEMKSIEAKSKLHKYGFKIFDYQLNTKTIQEKFTQTLFWLEIVQIEMRCGASSPLSAVSYSAELLGVLFTFNTDHFSEDRSSLMFIDVNV